MHPSARDRAHPIAPTRRLAALGLALALGCASAPPAPPAPGRAAIAPEGELWIELYFGAEADLDLYVSDPDHETAYFANSPVRSGGSHEQDLRCDASGARVERVVWPAPPPGRYRVGVDFPERCADVEAARYHLRVVGPGVARELEGLARFGRFDARALEFELEP
jgi:hypothetical protein